MSALVPEYKNSTFLAVQGKDGVEAGHKSNVLVGDFFGEPMECEIKVLLFTGDCDGSLWAFVGRDFFLFPLLKHVTF